mgnify:CR=1 FL=1
MNIDNMTYGELKSIAAIFSVSTSEAEPHHMAGNYVICRCESAGVHAGTLVSKKGQQVVLKDSRRLWSWEAKGGVALSGLAVHGLKGGKLDTSLDLIELDGVIETIQCTAAAQESINKYLP